MNKKSTLSNKELLESVIKDSVSKREVLFKFGLKALGSNYKTLNKYIVLYNLNTSHFSGKAWNKGENFKDFSTNRIDIKEILIENSTYTNSNRLRIRLINEHYKKYLCECCNLSQWLGEKIPLELDHINGINTDNRIENLRLLCPNCHAMTDTYRGKNINKTI